MNTLSKIKKLDKLVAKASKDLRLRKVFYNDIYFKRVKNYLKDQKFLPYSDLLKILKIRNFDEYPIGYIMIDSNKKVVGFMGTFFSDKLIANKKVIFCNIHSWIVDLNFRLYSFYLISEIIKKDINLTAYTPVSSLKGLLKKMGFKKKIMKYKIYYNASFINFAKLNYQFIENDKLTLRYLDKKNKEILNIYKDPIYRKIFLYNKIKKNYILIIGIIVKKKKINFFNIFYVSEKKILKENWNIIKHILTLNLKTRFFSEYFVDDSYFDLNSLISKEFKKNIYVKTKYSITYSELLNSDLLL